MILAIVIWVFSTKVVGDLLIQPLEEWKFFPKGDPKAVVVLGGGEAKAAKNLPTSAMGTKRILYGLMVGYKKELPVIVTGCEGERARKSVEEIVRGFDLPFKENNSTNCKRCFIIEGESKDTYQNALFTSKIAPKEIYLVTSAYHMPRSYFLFNHFGFKITPLSTDYKRGGEYGVLEFLPSYWGFENSFLALHEYLGILSLYLRGIL